MKYLGLLLLLIYCTKLSAQNPAPVTMEDKKMEAYLAYRKKPILTIRVKNLPDSVKKVNIKYSLVNLGIDMQTMKYTTTDQTGLSEIVLGNSFPYQQIWLSVGDYLYAGIYINEGLTVTVDAQKTPKDGAYMIGEGVEYTGKDGALNAVMNKNVLFKKAEKENIIDSLRKLRELKGKYTTDVFLFKIDSIRRQLEQIDNEFIAGFTEYSWAVKNETMSEFYGDLFTTYWFDTMPEVLYEAALNHQPYFTSNNGVLYYRYLQNYVLTKKQEKKPQMLESKLAAFDGAFSPQKSDILKLGLLETEKGTFTVSYPLIISNIKTNWCKKIAMAEFVKVTNTQKRIDSLLALSKKLETADIGRPLMKLPFEANLYQVDSLKNIDDFIISLKSKFANKALIIDFWATWCAPCLSDLPSSKSLHEKNKDLPIEYIYICTTSGSNINLWKNKIAELQLPGTHILIDEKIIAQLKTAFNAGSGYPAYVVIDANGKVDPKIISRMGALDRESVKKAAGL